MQQCPMCWICCVLDLDFAACCALSSSPIMVCVALCYAHCAGHCTFTSFNQFRVCKLQHWLTLNNIRELWEQNKKLCKKNKKIRQFWTHSYNIMVALNLQICDHRDLLYVNKINQNNFNYILV